MLIDIRRGERAPDHVISLWDVPGLAGVRENAGFRTGALTTISDLADVAANHPPLRAIADAAWLFGGWQVRNMCTVGGNICKASPGADMVPPLLCLDAELQLSGPDGERTTPLDGFLVGPDQTAIGPAEVLTEITMPAPPARTGTAFFKMMRRQAMDCSIVAVSARITLADDAQTCVEARVALGAVAPNPFRAKQAEALLAGKKLTPDLIREAARQAREAAKPIGDVRASAEYRYMLVETLVERAVAQAVERAVSKGKP
jgi:carbon-monoxide dehydrogenase medium subunit